ncbi:hypothetical protein CBR_g26258 [Chara braunii]|uniref:Reverse transcriptase domain-containing protein n=1 Tax=Chara braunii TaxID=69332 RepID=A0A388L7G7_CHABU|nr:hypothetical protein CBR_g26258 [Chara braunii]|eukprot:GBG78224.1 hypothetical protein CBR_g26258 [Chara braunii]
MVSPRRQVPSIMSGRSQKDRGGDLRKKVLSRSSSPLGSPRRDSADRELDAVEERRRKTQGSNQYVDHRSATSSDDPSLRRRLSLDSSMTQTMPGRPPGEGALEPGGSYRSKSFDNATMGRRSVFGPVEPTQKMSLAGNGVEGDNLSYIVGSLLEDLSGPPTPDRRDFEEQDNVQESSMQHTGTTAAMEPAEARSRRSSISSFGSLPRNSGAQRQRAGSISWEPSLGSGGGVHSGTSGREEGGLLRDGTGGAMQMEGREISRAEIEEQEADAAIDSLFQLPPRDDSAAGKRQDGANSGGRMSVGGEVMQQLVSEVERDMLETQQEQWQQHRHARRSRLMHTTVGDGRDSMHRRNSEPPVSVVDPWKLEGALDRRASVSVPSRCEMDMYFSSQYGGVVGASSEEIRAGDDTVPVIRDSVGVREGDGIVDGAVLGVELESDGDDSSDGRQRRSGDASSQRSSSSAVYGARDNGGIRMSRLGVSSSRDPAISVGHTQSARLSVAGDAIIDELLAVVEEDILHEQLRDGVSKTESRRVSEPARFAMQEGEGDGVRRRTELGGNTGTVGIASKRLAMASVRGSQSREQILSMLSSVKEKLRKLSLSVLDEELFLPMPRREFGSRLGDRFQPVLEFNGVQDPRRSTMGTGAESNEGNRPVDGHRAQGRSAPVSLEARVLLPGSVMDDLGGIVNKLRQDVDTLVAERVKWVESEVVKVKEELEKTMRLVSGHRVGEEKGSMDMELVGRMMGDLEWLKREMDKVNAHMEQSLSSVEKRMQEMQQISGIVTAMERELRDMRMEMDEGNQRMRSLERAVEEGRKERGWIFERMDNSVKASGDDGTKVDLSKIFSRFDRQDDRLGALEDTVAKLLARDGNMNEGLMRRGQQGWEMRNAERGGITTESGHSIAGGDLVIVRRDQEDGARSSEQISGLESGRVLVGSSRGVDTLQVDEASVDPIIGDNWSKVGLDSGGMRSSFAARDSVLIDANINTQGGETERAVDDVLQLMLDGAAARASSMPSSKNEIAALSTSSPREVDVHGGYEEVLDAWRKIEHAIEDVRVDVTQKWTGIKGEVQGRFQSLEAWCADMQNQVVTLCGFLLSAQSFSPSTHPYRFPDTPSSGMADITSAQWQAMLDAADEAGKPFFQKLYDDAVQREREAEAAARAANIADQVALLRIPEANADRFQEELAAAIAALVRLRTLENLESRVTALEQRNQELQAEIISLKQSQLSAPRPPNPRPAAVPVSQPNTVLMTRASGTVTSAGSGASSLSGSAGSSALVIVPNAMTSAQNATVPTGVQYNGPMVDKRAATLPSKYDGKADITSWISSMRSYFEVMRTPQEDRSMIMGTNTEPVVRNYIELQVVAAGYERIDLTEWLKLKQQRRVQGSVELTFFKLLINRRYIRVLIDSGSTTNFFSLNGIRKAGLGMKQVELQNPCQTQVGNQEFVTSTHVVKGVRVTFDKDRTVTHELNFYVMDKCPFDAVIGLGWLKAHCLRTTWADNQFVVRDAKGNERTVLLDEARESPVTLLSATKFCKSVRRRKEIEHVHVAFVKPIHVPSTFAAFSTLVSNSTSTTSASNPSTSTVNNPSTFDPNTSNPVVIAVNSRTDFLSPDEDDPPPEVPRNIRQLLDRFPKVLAEPRGVPERPVKHKIEIIEASVPPKGCVYRMGQGELEELRRQIDDMIDRGWIRPSESEFGAPVLFVPKKGGKLRMCIDYRGLNRNTRKNVYPLPRIDDLLDAAGGCKVFSKIDLKSCYHQIEVDPSDQHNTAFKTRDGLYEFIVMPFGLTNAPATFQCLMDKVLRRQLNWFVVVYLDDILIFSKTIEEHLNHLKEVLQVLKEAQLHLKVIGDDFGPSYVIDVPPHLRTYPVFHASKLFPHIDDETFPFRDPMIPRPIDGGHEIDQIVSHEGRGRNRQYKVHFLYHPLTEFFWIDRKELLKSVPPTSAAWCGICVPVFMHGGPIAVVSEQTLFVFRVAFDLKPVELDYSGMIGRWATVLQSMDFDIRHRKHERHGTADGLTRLHRPEKILRNEEVIPWNEPEQKIGPRYGQVEILSKQIQVTWTGTSEHPSWIENPELLIIKGWRTNAEGDLIGFLFGSVRPGRRQLIAQELIAPIDTLPSRQKYLKSYEIDPHAFYPRAEEVVIDDDDDEEEDDDEESSEEGSYSRHSEGELSEEEEEEEGIGSELEAPPEEATRTGTEVEDPEAARKREEIASGRRQLEFASEASLRIGSDPIRDPEPPRPEDGDPAAQLAKGKEEGDKLREVSKEKKILEESKGIVAAALRGTDDVVAAVTQIRELQNWHHTVNASFEQEMEGIALIFAEWIVELTVGFKERLEAHTKRLENEIEEEIRKTVNDRENVVVLEAIAGERADDVHSNGEVGFLRDGQRMQLAIGVAVVGFASSANFARFTIPSDIGNEVGPQEPLSKSCDHTVDSEVVGESRVVALAEKANLYDSGGSFKDIVEGVTKRYDAWVRWHFSRWLVGRREGVQEANGHFLNVVSCDGVGNGCREDHMTTNRRVRWRNRVWDEYPAPIMNVNSAAIEVHWAFLASQPRHAQDHVKLCVQDVEGHILTCVRGEVHGRRVNAPVNRLVRLTVDQRDLRGLRLPSSTQAEAGVCHEVLADVVASSSTIDQGAAGRLSNLNADVE